MLNRITGSHRKEAVADEVRRIFANHNAFAQHVIAELREKFKRGRIGVGGGDEFEQFEITGGIKEMGAEEMGFEIVRTAVCNFIDRNTRRIRGHEAARLANRFNPLHQRHFRSQLFDNDFNNPIRVRDLVKIIFGIADTDQISPILTR